MQPDEQSARSLPDMGHIADIEAIIESAKARDGKAGLERFIQRRLPGAEEAEVREMAEVATEIVDSIPVFLARARQEADQRGLRSVVGPVLDHAEYYFVQPMDLIPEMTQGLAGLLDDAYLVIRTLQNLDRGPEPFLDWDLDHPVAFLRGLVGNDIANRLDAIAMKSMQQVSARLAEAWSRMSHEA